MRFIQQINKWMLFVTVCSCIIKTLHSQYIYIVIYAACGEAFSFHWSSVSLKYQLDAQRVFVETSTSGQTPGLFLKTFDKMDKIHQHFEAKLTSVIVCYQLVDTCPS